MANTYLTRTPGSASNRTTWTWSAWIKRSAISTGSYQTLWNAGSSAADDIRLTITNNDQIIFGTDATTFFLTSQRIRDVSAWYHIVFAFDTTQGTASDRAKLYINGSLVTDFSTDNRSSLSGSYAYNNTVGHGIGRQAYSGSTYYDGYMAHIHFTDGTQYAASDFGQTDSTTGIWIPKTAPSVTYGTNGFFLKMENSGAMGTDSSGNSNTWSVGGGTLTQTKDTPTNVFPTWNALDKSTSVPPTLSLGNTTLSQPASGLSSNTTLGVSSGQWYFECEVTGVSAWLGVVPQNLHPASSNLFTASNTAGVYGSIPNLYLNGSLQGSLGGGVSNGDILMIAFDIDNGNFYVGKNGLWNDGLGGGFDQADFSNATAHSFTVKTGDNYVVGTVNGSGSTSYVLDINFGNGYFGTTAVSSGNADDAGIGIFEYAPPTGYYALCTKNIASYG